MQTLLRRALPVLLLLTVASGGDRIAAAEALPLVDDKWKHYRSPNFELYSHDGDNVSRNLLHDLELLRAVSVEQFKIVERARVEVTVFRFRTVDEFKTYGSEAWGKDHKFLGFYVSGPDRALISIAPAEDADSARAIIFHEYVHHLVRTAEWTPPAWINEGMAELLAGVRFVAGSVEIGRPREGRVLELRHGELLPLETLFAVDHSSPIYRSNNHTGMFYAQSWAFLHYLSFGDTSLPKDGAARFLKVAADTRALSRANLRELFRTCFGMDYPQMERKLSAYVDSGTYTYRRIPAPKIEPGKSYATRPAPREEIRLRLAELALRTNRSAMAKFLLVDAAAQPGAEPRIFEALGADALIEHDESTARERWEQAIEAGTKNVAVYRELSLLEGRTWLAKFDYDYRLPTELTARLRDRLQRAIEYEPGQSAAYEMLAWVEAYSEAPVFLNINLIQRRFATLRHKDRTLLALAMVRVRTRMLADAKELLDQINLLAPDQWTIDAAEVVRANLEGRATESPGRERNVGESPSPAKQNLAPSRIRVPLRVPSIAMPEKP